MNQTDMTTPNNSVIHFNSNSLIINREEGFLTLGDCEIGGGLDTVQNLIVCNHNVLRDDSGNFLDTLKSFIDENNVKGSFSALKTHQSLENAVSISQGKICSITIPQKTVSLKNVSANLKIIDESNYPIFWLTDNIIIIDHLLDANSLVKCFKTAIDAKRKVLEDMGVLLSKKEFQSNIEESIIVACLSPVEDNGKKDHTDMDYASLNELLQNIESCVKDGIQTGLRKCGISHGILDFIHHEGITIDNLVEAGMALCVGVEVTPNLKNTLRNQILKSLEDLNVIALIMAGIRVEEDFARHRLREVDVDDDPAYLYTDEVLGMAIANQIAGTKAIFNFKRYDEEKPGIISTLGPMLDDIFAGLVAGCMSKIFEE
jgi:alpha-ribazole phosphatase CobZ